MKEKTAFEKIVEPGPETSVAVLAVLVVMAILTVIPFLFP